MANPGQPVANSGPDDQAAKANNALWYTFQGIGRAYLVQRGSLAASDADVSGVHGYATIEQAVSNPNTVDWLSQPTISQWDGWASETTNTRGAHGVIETVNIAAPGTGGNKGTTPSSSTPQNPATSAASGWVGSITGFHGTNFVLRAIKVLVGGLLVMIGLVHMTGADNAVAQVVKKVPLPV